MPSITRCGSSSRITRSLKAPGSLSSALQTTYLGVAGSLPTSSHLRPVGKPAPPMPRRPDCPMRSRTAAKSPDRAILRSSP